MTTIASDLTSPIPHPSRGLFASLLFAGMSLSCAGELWAEQHTAGVPELSSRPGADYTIYLNVAGFTFTGAWGGSSNNPGTTLAVNDRLPTDTFTTDEQTQIKAIWSRVAQSYVGFNVNVTTVDPAIAALGAGATDAQRQVFYDATPNMMHTIVGSQNRAALVGLPDSDPGTTDMNPSGKWYSTGADGVSGLGIVAGVTGNATDHTNWMFTEAQAGAATGGVINGDYIGAVSAHENAHAFGLYHQGDWNGATKVNEYSLGDTTGGDGSYVPIIGQAAGKQRVTWRVGDTGGPTDTRTPINDIQSMLSINNVSNGRTGTANLHLVNDGIGHTLATATPLPVIGDLVNFSLATGVIVPNSESNPLAIGAGNYAQDWFSFTLASSAMITLTANNGTQFLTAGVADGVGTLRSTLSIYDGNGLSIGTAIEDSSTLFETFMGNLTAGTYYAKVGSFGGHEQIAPAFNSAQYFDRGAYFLTGSGFAAVVPEPGTMILLGAGSILLFRRRRA